VSQGHGRSLRAILRERMPACLSACLGLVRTIYPSSDTFTIGYGSPQEIVPLIKAGKRVL